MPDLDFMLRTMVREANNLGYHCVVLVSSFLEFHDVRLKMIKTHGGIFGSEASPQAVLAGLEMTYKK